MKDFSERVGACAIEQTGKDRRRAKAALLLLWQRRVVTRGVLERFPSCTQARMAMAAEQAAAPQRQRCFDALPPFTWVRTP